MVDPVITEIWNISKIVIPRKKTNYIKNDPQDNIILKCAVGSKADYIISGDEHLLALKNYKAIQILNVSDFIKVIVEKKR